MLSKHNLTSQEFLLVILRKILKNAMREGKESGQQLLAQNRDKTGTVCNLLSVLKF
jgi:hypothetical protein